jgi:hypothetical protein
MPNWWDQPTQPLTGPDYTGHAGEFARVNAGENALEFTAAVDAFGIGEAITDATAGSVLFVDADGELAEDNDHFVYDADTLGLRIGSGGPLFSSTSGLLLNYDDTNALQIVGGNNARPLIVGRTAGGTVALPDASSAGDMGLRVLASAHDGTDSIGYAEIDFVLAADPTPGVVLGELRLSTNDPTGSGQERLRLTSQSTAAVTSPDAGDAATADIGSGGNGTVTLTLANAGAFGNSYTVEVVVSEDNDADLDASLDGTALTVTLGTDSGGDPDDAKNTATLVAAAIDALAAFTASASGSGATPLDSAEGPTTFADGRDGSTVVMAGQVEIQGDLLQTGSGRQVVLGSSLNPTTFAGAQQIITRAHSAGSPDVNLVFDDTDNGYTQLVWATGGNVRSTLVVGSTGQTSYYIAANYDQEVLRLTGAGSATVTSPDSNSNFVLAGQSEIQGDFIQTGASRKVGFFDHAAALQQAHIADPAANAAACATAIASILDALEAYGLLAAS